MAYIGRQLARGENKLFDDISSSFNGSTTAFNLTVSSVATATATPYQLFVSLGGVMQKPNTDFTTAGNQITFTTAPAAGLSCWIMMQGDTIDNAAVADASVTPSKISGSNFAFSGDLRLKDADGSHYVGFASPSSVTTNKVWTLPAADGSNGQFLKTNGSAVLAWDTVDTSTLMPLAGGTFSGDVTFAGASSKNLLWDNSDGALEFNDNAKATFGTGGDLEIFHNASNSVINDAGTGDLLLQVGGSTKATVSSTGLGVTGALTVSTNATITGNLTVNGTTTTVDSVTLSVKDKNIEMGVVSSPSDTTADGGGITLKGATDKTINWVNSTDAWTFSEHINLASGKKLGVGGANYGTSGQVLTSGGSGAAPSWAAVPAGGNVITAEAEGAIANNKAVKIRTDGKVEEIKVAVTEQSTLDMNVSANDNGSGVGSQITNSGVMAVAWSTTSSIGALVYKHTNSSPYPLRVRPFTFSSGATGGNPGLESTVDMNNFRSEEPQVAWDSTNNKFFIAYKRDSDDTLFYTYGFPNASSNATAITQSNVNTQIFSQASSYNRVCFAGSGRIFVCFKRNSNNSGRGGIFTWNGSSNVYDSGGTATIDGNNNIDLYCGYHAANDKVLYAYIDGGDSNKLKMRVGTISGTGTSASITWASADTVDANDSLKPSFTVDVNSGKIFMLYYDNRSGQKKWLTRVGTLSGTSTSWGSSTAPSTGNQGTAGDNAFLRGTVSYLPNLQKNAVFYNGHNGRVYAVTGTISGTSISLANYHMITDWSTWEGLSSAAIGDDSMRNQVWLFGRNTSHSNNGTYKVMRFTEEATNLTDANHYLGFADQAYTDGQTATIKTVGNVATTLSGLTAGTKYYVQNNGTLATSTQAPNCLGGLALSSSKLLIREPKADV